MTEEHAIQNAIRIALSEYATVFRANVGSGVTYDGRHFETGLPNGFSDLFGFRHSDGKIFFIEVKTSSGRLSKDQKNFLEKMRNYGAIAGVARSVDDALSIIIGGNNYGNNNKL